MKFVLFVLLVCLSSFSFATDSLPGLKETKIVGADIFCANKGVMYAVNFKDRRVWQSSAHNETGLELQNIQIQMKQCLHCAVIAGTLHDIEISLSTDLKADGELYMDGLLWSKTEDDKLSIDNMLCSTSNARP